MSLSPSPERLAGAPAHEVGVVLLGQVALVDEAGDDVAVLKLVVVVGTEDVGGDDCECVRAFVRERENGCVSQKIRVGEEIKGRQDKNKQTTRNPSSQRRYLSVQILLLECGDKTHKFQCLIVRLSSISSCSYVTPMTKQRQK